MKVGNILDVIHPSEPGLDEPEMRVLHCPVCGCEWTHVTPPHLSYGEKWGGNAELAVSPVWSECGSVWQVCIGFHKGESVIFTRLIESCVDAKAKAKELQK